MSESGRVAKVSPPASLNARENSKVGAEHKDHKETVRR